MLPMLGIPEEFLHPVKNPTVTSRRRTHLSRKCTHPKLILHLSSSCAGGTCGCHPEPPPQRPLHRSVAPSVNSQLPAAGDGWMEMVRHRGEEDGGGRTPLTPSQLPLGSCLAQLGPFVRFHSICKSNRDRTHRYQACTRQLAWLPLPAFTYIPFMYFLLWLPTSNGLIYTSSSAHGTPSSSAAP